MDEYEPTPMHPDAIGASLTVQAVQTLARLGPSTAAQVARAMGMPSNRVRPLLHQCASRGLYGVGRNAAGRWVVSGELAAHLDAPALRQPDTRIWRVAFALAAMCPARPAEVAKTLGESAARVRAALSYCARNNLHGVKRHPSGEWTATVDDSAWNLPPASRKR